MLSVKEKQTNKTDERLSLDALQDVSGGKTLPWNAAKGGLTRVRCEKCGEPYSYSAGTSLKYHKCPKCGTIN